MKRLLWLAFALSMSCGSPEDGCTPAVYNDTLQACKAACGAAGVKRVTYSACTCNTVR